MVTHLKISTNNCPPKISTPIFLPKFSIKNFPPTNFHQKLPTRIMTNPHSLLGLFLIVVWLAKCSNAKFMLQQMDMKNLINIIAGLGRVKDLQSFWIGRYNIKFYHRNNGPRLLRLVITILLSDFTRNLFFHEWWLP